MPPKIILKSGAKPFEFFDRDETSRCLPIFFDIESKKKTVQCNWGGVHVNSSHLARHQQAAVCNQKVASNARMRTRTPSGRGLLKLYVHTNKKCSSLRPLMRCSIYSKISNLIELFLWLQTDLLPFYPPKESEQGLPAIAKAGMTPRAFFSNLMFEDAHETCANDREPSSPLPWSLKSWEWWVRNLPLSAPWLR